MISPLTQNQTLAWQAEVMARLLRFLGEQPWTLGEIAQRLVLPPDRVRNWLQNPHQWLEAPDWLKRVAIAFPEVNMGWLLSGQGPMYFHAPDYAALKEEIGHLTTQVHRLKASHKLVTQQRDSFLQKLSKAPSEYRLSAQMADRLLAEVLELRELLQSLGSTLKNKQKN